MTAARASLRVVAGAASGAPSGAPQVVRERPWLVSDALVSSRLTGHPVLPVRDATLRRNARVVAFALNLLALPDAGAGAVASLAAVDVTVDVDALGARLALPAAAIEEALRALWVAEVLRVGSDAGTARFAEDLLAPTPLAYAVRWGAVAEGLLDRRGEGALAAVGLFRLVLDRLTHPRAPVTLPASLVQEQLGLSEDQARRGARTLVQRGLVVEQTQAGRAKQLLLADAVLVGVVPAAVAPSPVAPFAVAPAPIAPSPAAPLSVTPAPSPAAPGTLIEYAGQRIELPAQAELSVAIPGTRVAGMRLDPASGRLIVTLEPVQPAPQV